jgi:hypothetical protein
MPPDTAAAAIPKPANYSSGAGVREILVERGWLGMEHTPETDPALGAWLERAAFLLGPQAADRAALAKLLELIFNYDARTALLEHEAQSVLAREGAREVIREFANRVLESGEIESGRFKEIIDALKSSLPYRSRALFHPIRLALAGRAGEGELDRVILLLDAAAKIDFAVPVKGTRQRMLEFCAALD